MLFYRCTKGNSPFSRNTDFGGAGQMEEVNVSVFPAQDWGEWLHVVEIKDDAIVEVSIIPCINGIWKFSNIHWAKVKAHQIPAVYKFMSAIDIRVGINDVVGYDSEFVGSAS